MKSSPPEYPSLIRAEALGAAAALAAFFSFPWRADPIPGLIFGFLAIALAIALAAHVWARTLGGRERLRAAPIALLASPAALAAGGFAVWALARWRLSSLPAPGDSGETFSIVFAGRALAVGYLFLPIGFLLGAAIGGPDARATAETLHSFRRLLAVLAILLALHGFYQRFIGYERDLAQFERSLREGRTLSPLMEQSLRHALTEKRVGGRMGNGNLFAAQLAVLGALSLSLLRGRKGDTYLGSAAAILSGGAILLSASRGGLLTFVVGCAGGAPFLLLDRRSSRGGRAAATAALALLFLFSARPASAGLLDRLMQSDTIRERVYYWQIAVDAWSRNPIAGAGLGAYEILYPSLKPPLARETKFAHSWLFHSGAETGALGVALFSAYWLALAWALVSSLRRREDLPLAREALWLAWGALLLGFNGLFEQTLQWREFLFLAGLLGGAASTAKAWGNPDGEVRRSAFQADVGLKARPAHLLFSARAAIGAALLAIPIVAAVVLLPSLQMASFWEWAARDAANEGDRAAAAKFYARAGARLPDDPGYLAAEAMELASQSAPSPADLANAESMLQRVAQMQPTSARFRQFQSTLASLRGDREGAARKLAEAVELYPNDAGYRLKLADALAKLGRPDDAREQLAFIDENRLPLWEYERPRARELREKLGLPDPDQPTKAP